MGAALRVLLIQSYLGPSVNGLCYPLGLAYIAAAAERNGHVVRIVDPNAMPDGLNALKNAIQAYDPECIGISLRNIDSQNRTRLVYYYRYFQQTLGVAAESAADVPVIVGGPGFSMFPEKIMRRNSRVDFGVHLEAEESFPELLDNLGRPGDVKGLYHRKDAEVVYTGVRPFPDFATLPYPRRDFLDLRPYREVPFSMGVQTKRGCPLKCAYCNYPDLNGKNFRLRAVADICDELAYLVNDCDVRDVSFADSILNMPPSHTMALCREIRSRKIDVRWEAYMLLSKRVDHEFAELAMQAGCKSMLFSPDGISQPTLDKLRKGTTEQDLTDVFDLFRKNADLAPLRVGFCYFLNPPGETIRGLVKAVAFFLRVALSRLEKGSRMRAYVNWIRIEPATRSYEIAVEEGVLDKNIDLLPDEFADLRKTFYDHPKLKAVNPILMFFLRVFNTTWDGVRRLRSSGLKAGDVPLIVEN